MAVASTFAGFPPEGIQFMADLAANNDRAWFQPRKGEYERLVKEPMELLMVALAERFEARGIPLVADPKRSPFRIYRDTRFSRDKSPYKTHIGASLPWVEGRPATGEGDAEGMRWIETVSPLRRRPAVPVADEKVVVTTWDVSTAFAEGYGPPPALRAIAP